MAQRDWKSKFLVQFRETGLVSEACRVVGVGRTTVYDARQADEEFALAWHDIEEETTETMEREARRRAAEGVLKPVYQGGQQVGEVREYSDTLLIFMLKARRPETYRDNVKVEHSGRVGHDVKLEVPDDEQRRREVAEILHDAGALGD